MWRRGGGDTPRVQVLHSIATHPEECPPLPGWLSGESVWWMASTIDPGNTNRIAYRLSVAMAVERGIIGMYTTETIVVYSVLIAIPLLSITRRDRLIA